MQLTHIHAHTSLQLCLSSTFILLLSQPNAQRIDQHGRDETQSSNDLHLECTSYAVWLGEREESHARVSRYVMDE